MPAKARLGRTGTASPENLTLRQVRSGRGRCLPGALSDPAVRRTQGRLGRQEEDKMPCGS